MYTHAVFLDRHPLAGVEIINIYKNENVPQQPPNIPPEVWQTELFFFRMHKSKRPIIGMERIFGLRVLDDDFMEGFEEGRPKSGLRLTLWKVCVCICVCVCMCRYMCVYMCMNPRIGSSTYA